MFAIKAMKHGIRFERIKDWYEKYERYLIPGSLLFGIITDFILFQQINIGLAFFILTFHIALSGSVIAYIHLYDNGIFRTSGKFRRYLRLFSPLIIQYSFGALLSGFFIFYWFSGVFSASWPFIVIIIFLMVSNDLLKKYYLRLPVQIGVYFFLVFSYCVLVLPFLLRSMSVWIFILSGALSLIIIYLYVRALKSRIPRIGYNIRLISSLIIGVFVGMNFLYFANIIPPIPLSLRDIGVYHSIERVGENYHILAEERSFWERVTFRRSVSIADDAGRLYIFSAVFAPIRLDTEIVHNWQRYSEESGKWLSVSRIQYPIFGGRDGGYRGYTISSKVIPGRWRVNVETLRGQIIGRVAFRVDRVDEMPELYEDIK